MIMGDDQRPSATLGFRLNEGQSTIDPLKLITHRQDTLSCVDVLPAQSQGFALPQTHGKGHREQGFEPMTSDVV